MDFENLKKTRAIVPEGLEALYENWHFAPAVVTGRTVYLSGIIGAEADLSVSGDPQTQFVRVFETMGQTLRAAGTDFSRVVELTSYHVELNAHFALFTAVKDRYFPQPYCAWTAIGVSELLLPGALVEVRAIARLR